MDITLDRIWKRYTTGWVLKDISEQIQSCQKVAITGNNGSGKSTLVQLISGFLSPSKGTITYGHLGKSVDRDKIYSHCAIAAAYVELDEELTISEIFEHYIQFKPFMDATLSGFISMTDFSSARDKRIRYFSSGMKQRLSLGLAFNMAVPLLLLDEPTSFLDSEKKGWYAEMLSHHTKDKTVIIASNDEQDISSCQKTIRL